MKAMCIYDNGSPAVLEWTDVTLSEPAPAEVQPRQTAIGLNASDINVRNCGLYITEGPPISLVLEHEAAGVVGKVRSEVAGFKPADRAAYAGTGRLFFENIGTYAEARDVPSNYLNKLPDDTSDQQGAGMLPVNPSGGFKSKRHPIEAASCIDARYDSNAALQQYARNYPDTGCVAGRHLQYERCRRG